MIVDKGCAERGCACYDDRVDEDGVEMVDLEPLDTAFVFDQDGHLKNIYLPKDGDRPVPEIIIQIIELATGNKLGE